MLFSGYIYDNYSVIWTCCQVITFYNWKYKDAAHILLLEFVQLKAEGALKSNSSGYYDAELATWIFSLNLVIHSSTRASSMDNSRIMFRLDLASPTEAELKSNSTYNSLCQNTLPFTGDCRERNAFTKYFQQRNESYAVNFMIKPWFKRVDVLIASVYRNKY